MAFDLSRLNENERKMLARESAKLDPKNGHRFDGADDYYGTKEHVRKLEAKAMNDPMHNPMGFWFGMQSN